MPDSADSQSIERRRLGASQVEDLGIGQFAEGTDFIARLAQYRVNQYEPKDFQREQHLEQSSKGGKGSP